MIYFFMVIFFLAGYFLGGVSLALYAFRKGWFKEAKTSAADSLATIVDEAYAQEMPGELSKPNADFSVAGRPRTAPWHIRRKELEAAARTKREKREQFRDA